MITYCVDKLNYKQDPESPASNLLETKILLNNAMSNADKGARFICADVKDHFLITLIDESKHKRAQHKCIPNNIRLCYNLNSKEKADRTMFIKTQKGMLDLRQAAILAHRHLKNCFKPFGCQPIKGTAGL